MVVRNPYFVGRDLDYFFLEVKKRVSAFLKKRPEVRIISLGVGDTTEPVPATIGEAMSEECRAFATAEGYRGYGPYEGLGSLRAEIAERYYAELIDKDEIFISDGIKSDMARLQILFGNEVSVALQDPIYPAYLSSSKITGKNNIVHMPCVAESGFFPVLDKTKRADLIFFCSPNNPTGSVSSRDQLERLVEFAGNNGSIIIFDAAYRDFIRDPSLPQTIYEIKGAKEVAIEFGSFSKYAGFTGIRLGWAVFPKDLTFSDGSSVADDWRRVLASCYNGTSLIAQRGGLAALTDEGKKALGRVTDYYMENAGILKRAMTKIGWSSFGGENAPYLWVQVPEGRKSWDVFNDILTGIHIVTTPGVGFGVCGEGYIRLSAFGHRENIEEAAKRFVNHFS